MSPSQPDSAVIHSVHFYGSDEALIGRLRNLISSAINAGNSILAIATEVHRRQLASALKEQGFDLDGLADTGRVTLCDAQELIAQLIQNGLPDSTAFYRIVGELIENAKQTSWNAHRGLTVFGEMVAVLWQSGNRAAALTMEALWNDLLTRHAFHLHCAYPRGIFSPDAEYSQIRDICDHHSHVIGQAA